jgi:hypothetical protein
MNLKILPPDPEYPNFPYGRVLVDQLSKNLFAGSICPSCKIKYDVKLKAIKRWDFPYTFSIYSRNPETGNVSDGLGFEIDGNTRSVPGYGIGVCVTPYMMYYQTIPTNDFPNPNQCDAVIWDSDSPCTIDPVEYEFQWEVTQSDSNGYFEVLLGLHEQPNTFTDCDYISQEADYYAGLQWPFDGDISIELTPTGSAMYPPVIATGTIDRGLTYLGNIDLQTILPNQFLPTNPPPGGKAGSFYIVQNGGSVTLSPVHMAQDVAKGQRISWNGTAWSAVPPSLSDPFEFTSPPNKWDVCKRYIAP